MILRSNPRNLHSNIQYLTHFRHPSRMLAESGYYFVSFLTAVSFIETLDASALCINPKDFDSLISGNPIDTNNEKSMEEAPKKLKSSDSIPGIESSDKEDSEWVWLPRKSGKSIYLNEKKLFSHLMTEELAAVNSQKADNKKEEWRPNDKVSSY